MKFLIASSFVPFINGGGRFIVEWLSDKLRESGHEVDQYYLPFNEHQDVILKQLLAYRLIDVEDKADRLVAIRPPSYLIRHPHKITWFIHHIRSYYDLAGTAHQGYSNDVKGHAIRDALHDIDSAALAESKAIFTNSQTVTDRLKHFNRLDSEVLYPPLMAPERFRNEFYGDEIVVICRVEAHKQQELLIEAMQHTRSGVRLRLCGVSANPDYDDKLRRLVASSPAKERIVFENRWITEAEKETYVGQALAIAYVPLDEDSYGYPTLEAAHAEKAILTHSEAGGVLEFVENEKSGLVVEASAKEVGAAMDRLYDERELTKRMGRAAKERLSELNISWEHVIDRFVR